MLKKYSTIIIIIVMTIISTASGLPEILNIFNSKYGTSKTKLDSCELCHIPDKPNEKSCGFCHKNYKPAKEKFNVFGKDIQKNLNLNRDRFFNKIEVLDSVNNGIPNIDEIRNKSFPGNCSDKKEK